MILKTSQLAYVICYVFIKEVSIMVEMKILGVDSKDIVALKVFILSSCLSKKKCLQFAKVCYFFI